MNNVYALTLRAPDGREQRTLAGLPNEAVRRNFYDKARKRRAMVRTNYHTPYYMNGRYLRL